MSIVKALILPVLSVLSVLSVLVAGVLPHSANADVVTNSLGYPVYESLRWSVEMSESEPKQLYFYRGETVDMSVQHRLYGVPLAVTNASTTCTFYYQTNGMDNAWWTKPGTISPSGVASARWTPLMDNGAAKYIYFFRLSDNNTTSKVYRANGNINMLYSPGVSPNSVPMPVQSIDFAAVPHVNAPWLLPDATNGMLRVEQDLVALPRVYAIESSTNYWNQAFGWGDHAAIGYLTNELDPVAYPVATNALAVASTALQPPATNGLLRVEADTLATVTGRDGTTPNAVTIGSRGAGAVGVSSFANGYNVVASGKYSHAEGISTTASGYGSHAEGGSTTASGASSHAEGIDTTASERGSHASGFNSVASNITSFAWQGAASVLYYEPKYGSHGNGTFNINPVGGLAGLWIGETNMATTLSGYATTGAVDDKVSTNHVGDVEIAGNVSATSFIGDGSRLSGVSGGVEFPELIIYSSGATTSIPFTKDYKYYQVVVTNSTDVSFDYTGIGDFTGSVLEFQIRLTLVNPSDAVTIPADGVAGLKYVGDIDISATITNTVQHLGMLMYSTNNVLLSHWFFDEP